MNEVNSHFISVIIPVYNDAIGLRKCLSALDIQTYPKTAYEVIVVDNGSEECISNVVDPFENALVVIENEPGSYAARNKGISVAKGSLLAFTDADCMPARDWLEKGVDRLLRVPNCGLIAGRVEFCFQDPDRPTVVELCDSVMHLQQEAYLQKFNYGVTANVFTFREVFDKVGLFNNELKSGGDHEWGQRVFLSGYQQSYASDAYVLHPARYSFEALYKKILRTTTNTGSYNLNRAKNAAFLNSMRDLARNLVPPVKAFNRVQLDDKFLKFRFMLMLTFMRYLIFFEKLKSQF